MTTLRISTLADPFAKPATVETTWPDLRTSLQEHREAADKRAVPLWTPATFSKPRRLLTTAIAASCLVLDQDDGGLPELQAVVARLAADGIGGVCHSSYRYNPVDPDHRVKGRVVVHLSEPVKATAWKRFWSAVRQHYAPQSDPQCSDITHAYFLPSCKPGAPRFAFAWEGGSLNVGPWLLRAATPQQFAPPSGTLARVHRDDLVDLGKRWKRNGKGGMARTLKSLIDGESYADPGARDNTTFQLTKDIVRDLPWVETSSLVDLFRPSLQAMGAELEYAAKVADQIERARHSTREEAQKARSLIDMSLPAPASSVKAGYAPGEVDPSATPLIVQTDCDSKLYLYTEGNYVGPIKPEHAMARISTLLHPAVEAGLVSLTTAEAKIKPIWRLVTEYGRCVSSVEWEVGRQTASITRAENEETDILLLGCGVRTAEPRWSEHCDRFLRAFSGGDEQRYKDLLTWFVVARFRPRDPLAAIVLTGPKDVGKNLFAHAAASLWTASGPTVAATLFDQFQDDLMRCPLVFADEELPPDLRGRNRSASIRRLITAREISCNMKFLPRVKIRGAYRWVIAVNDARSIAFSDEMSPDDLDAVLERLYHVPVPREVSQHYLTGWIDPKQVEAEMLGHIAYIHDHVASQPGGLEANLPRSGRLWIRQDAPTHMLRPILASHGPLRERVVQWIAMAVLIPERLSQTLGRRPLSGPHDWATYRVCVRDLIEGWRVYVDDPQTPSPHRVSRALALLGRSLRSGFASEAGVAFLIPVSVIADAAEAARMATGHDVFTAHERACQRSGIQPQPSVH